MNTPDLLRKAIANPRKVPRAFWERVGQDAALEAYRRAHRIDSQRTRIHEFVSNDEFALIVLDACRYDVFKRLHSRFITGDLQRVWASGRWTAEYAARTWTEYYDLTYINSMPVNSDFYFELRGKSHRPSEHIETLVHVWEDGWDPERGTVPAETMTDTALGYASQMDDIGLVVHYAQPHVPYIGATEILPWNDDPTEESSQNTGMRQLLSEGQDRPTQRIYNRIKNGQISVHELHRAYTDNLEYVLAEVVRLVRRLDCPVAITGDHGEHLGENDRYLHESDSILIRQVPWFIVDPNTIDRRRIEEKYREMEIFPSDDYQVTEGIEDRLASLGYVE
ncbi:sulfatase-like hydrolase/transferase [Halococcus sp. IIIV-5B]|uniref:sulfatase-like hydrolase/transferase n=1 Tax=Halococcus sp. IIIV-5B TaxID=2321230 RepID=UPI000E723EA9|nr:sulfatase-like hydrolase/transferase [Halococcus sp. IIIV-5B]RJS97461.1 hypothetical protein D3261_18030 [Halococcus sp. IIIV-5B]